MMGMSENQLIRKMSNSDLKSTLNRIRKEKADPGKYGKGGSSRYITSTEFWRGSISNLRNELERRKRLGLISKSAGVRKQNLKNKISGYNLGNVDREVKKLMRGFI